MGTKHSKSEYVKEKEKENTIENHRLARSKEKEVKKQLGSIARENGHKEEEISAYNEQEKKTIDKRLSEITEREKIKRSANETINGFELETDKIHEFNCNIMMGSRINLWDAKEELQDHFPTLPHFLVLSDYIPPPAPPPPDLLDGLYPDDQQQHIYYTPLDIENNIPHFLVLSSYIPPPAPLPQDLLGDLNPNNQQQQHIYFTPSDTESIVTVFDEDLPPNPILAQHENPVPPPPDYLE